MSVILVTGATGNVGSHVVRELQARGVPVRTFVRDTKRARSNLGDDVELTRGDFDDPASIRAALSGVDRVFLLSPNHPHQVAHETNVIDAAADAGVGRIVKLSAVGAEIGSPLEFWDTHGRIERHLQASEVPAVVLRPNAYMSILLAFAPTIVNLNTIFAPAGDAKIAMIDPRDVAAAAAVALTDDGHDGHTYTLSGPETVTYSEIAERLSAATGREIAYVNVPDAAAREGLAQAGLPDWVAERVVILFSLLREGAAAQATDVVRTLTGREPRNVSDFIHDYAEAFGG